MITQKRVLEVFKYKQGELFWRVNLGSRAKVGVKAGNLTAGGYYTVQVDGKQYYIHRLIYLYHYGYMPKFIDHKYGKSVGDYIWNLRPCTHAQNMANKSKPKSNTSGYVGVGFDKRSGKWYARTKYYGVMYELGFYSKPEEASKEVEKKRKELHGKFYKHT